MTPRERQWRRRNPDLAARFDRLPKAAQANIRTVNWRRGTAGIVRQADVVRREGVAARSRARRAAIKAIYLPALQPQAAKYRIWMVDAYGNVRAVRDTNRAPGNILGRKEYTHETRYKDNGLTVAAVTIQ